MKTPMELFEKLETLICEDKWRNAEIKNLQQACYADEYLFGGGELQREIAETRRRTQELIDNPHYAGNHEKFRTSPPQPITEAL